MQVLDGHVLLGGIGRSPGINASKLARQQRPARAKSPGMVYHPDAADSTWG